MQSRIMAIAASIAMGAISTPSFSQQGEGNAGDIQKFPKTTVDSFRVNTDSPVGGLIGIYGGPLANIRFSEEASATFLANIGASITFKQDGNTTRAELSPTVKLSGRYDYSLGKLLVSFGLSASGTQVDPQFYGKNSLHGLTADAAAGLKVFKELDVFASSKSRVLGDLPNIRTVGATYTPFASSETAWKGFSLTGLYSRSSQNSAMDTMLISSATGVIGFEWKMGLVSKAFAGVACSQVSMEQVQHSAAITRTAHADVCLPIFSFSGSF